MLRLFCISCMGLYRTPSEGACYLFSITLTRCGIVLLLMVFLASSINKDLPPAPGEQEDQYVPEDEYYGEQPAIANYLTAQSTGYTTKRLSTISERTEESRAWPSRQDLLAAHSSRRPPSTQTSSSYGQVWARPPSVPFTGSIPPTPNTFDSGFTTTDYGEVIGG